jgi:RNA polymerase sigma-70 factor, ECF subfamily
MTDASSEFTALFVRWRGMLSSYILSLVRDPTVAEDLLQDVALNLLNKFDTFDGKDFGAWARQVAKWHVMNHWRSDARYRRVLSETTINLMEEQYREGASAFLSWEVRKDALHRCMQDMDAETRRLLEMRFVDGLGLPVIAERIGKKIGAIQMRIMRMKDRLAECVRARTTAMER